ncbi:hypothetical protein NE857_14300 [Nocardiopsis exhalans]|uniref:Uncharacterized protein n=1 Tax=Nocardiopsis exhalans TaxID=163604 RepID=A0ABY5DF81_9ACTN|nr:hypothetical protein [Nocardiopsis exhalans]USY22672.1 hypothetical protein NE857_14300 [Nocardiopsis exhalans]
MRKGADEVEDRWDLVTGPGDGEIVRVRLDDGQEAEVSPPMMAAVARARPQENRPDLFSLDPGVPEKTVSDLVAGGLAGYDEDSGGWCLTVVGAQLRSALVLDAHRHHAEPRGVSVHPELSEDDRELLVKALNWEGREPEPVQPSELAPADPAPRSPTESVSALVILLAAVIGVLCVALISSFETFALLLLPGLLLGAGALYSFQRQRAAQTQAIAENDEPDVIEELQGHFVTGDMLDTPARWMLGRAQRAVDAVLDSAIHQRGLLLDEVRNRVVLADVEWAVAQSLLRQSRARARIETTPLTGERSRQAAERARAALHEDVAEVERRIRTLEDYARRVREAELEEQDRRSAVELDAIADSTTEAGAAHPHQEEALSHLVRAQELALRVAALSDDAQGSS